MKTISTLILTMFLSICTLSGQQTLNESLMYDGVEREYILYIPASYNPETPAPVVLSFHGYTSSAAINFAYTNFRAIADTAGFILIHPQGTVLNGSTHWNVGGWTLGSTVDDVGFTSALLDKTISDYNIDEERIYSTGMSNGGYMSFLLACQLSDRIAAVASVTGSMTIQTYNNCDPQHPTPVLQIHGTADGTVPYNGSPTWTKSIEDVLDYWVDYNQCETTPVVTQLPDIDTNDNSTVDHWIYNGGLNGVKTEHFKVFDGDHDWPGAWGNMDINASQEVWRFFSKYDINGWRNDTTVGINEALAEGAGIHIFPNPITQSIALISAEVTGQDYYIYSIFGELVLQGTIHTHQQEIDLSALGQNVYFLRVGKQTLRLIKTQ